MPQWRQARLGIINDRLQPDEEILFDVLALLLDPGGELKPREAEGHLVLSDRRLVFGTAKHGILVDLMVEQIKVPVKVRNRLMMAHLTMSDVYETVRTFVVNKRSAEALASAINRGFPGLVTLPGSFRG